MTDYWEENYKYEDKNGLPSKLGRKGPKYKLSTVLQAIEGSGGIQTLICQRLKCGRNLIGVYIKKYPAVRQAYENECEVVFDIAESEIIKKIKAGDVTMLIWYSKTKMKKRGYVEKKSQEELDPEEFALRINKCLKDLQSSVPKIIDGDESDYEDDFLPEEEDSDG